MFVFGTQLDLGPSWGRLGAVLRASWGHLGAVLERLGNVLGRLGGVLRLLGGEEPARACLGAVLA